MEKYYVHGCRSNGDEIERCEDSEAQFWTLYARDSEGLSQGVIDCVFREDAVAAMAVYVERDRLNEQVRALAAEGKTYQGVVFRLISILSLSGYTAAQDSLNPAEALLFDAEKSLDSPATDAVLNEVAARAVEGAAMGFHEKAFVAFENSYETGPFIRADLQQYAARIRAGEVTNV